MGEGEGGVTRLFYHYGEVWEWRRVERGQEVRETRQEGAAEDLHWADQPHPLNSRPSWNLRMRQYLEIEELQMSSKGCQTSDFPGGPVAKTAIPMQGAQDSIPGQGTRSRMPHLRVRVPQLKSVHAKTKIIDPSSCN